MKPAIVLISLLLVHWQGKAQSARVINSDTFKVARIPAYQGDTPSQGVRLFLGIPANYSIRSFYFIVSSKGEVFKAFADGEKYTPIMIEFMDRAIPGNKITIEATVEKDGRTIKWMPKTWTVQ